MLENKASFELEFKGPVVVVHHLNTQGERSGQNTAINTAKLKSAECSEKGAVLQAVKARVKRKKDDQEVELRVSCDSYKEAIELKTILLERKEMYNSSTMKSKYPTENKGGNC